MKLFAVTFIDFSPSSDEFPNTHEELFSDLETAKAFVEWDIKNLNSLYPNSEPKTITWNGYDAIVTNKTKTKISKYRICEVDPDIHTELPF